MQLSIIIPVWNEAEQIVARLERLQPFIAAGHELIVVDGGSSDGTPTLAAPLCSRLLRGPRGRAAQMNLGARFAAGDLLLFLHADNSLPPHAAAALSSTGGAGEVWGWFQVRLSGELPAFRVLATFMNLRSRLTSICTGDQALFVSLSLFRRIGGFPDIPLMEDIAICKRLRKLAPPRPLGLTTVTSSRRWESKGLLRTVLQMWWLRLRYFLGVPAERLAQAYYPSAPVAETPWRYPAARMLLFAKAPVAGEVKTRLAVDIGEDAALALYLAMLRRVFETARCSGLAPVRLWAASNPDHKEFTALCDVRHIRRQQGSDLGERMRHAVATELAAAGVEAVLIIGSDCPSLTAEYLDEALAALASGCDLVLGPARDGGYVLIGLRQARAELFSGIDWGSDRVLQQTLARARKLGLKSHLLAQRRDVDTVADLASLQTLRPPLDWESQVGSALPGER